MTRVGIAHIGADRLVVTENEPEFSALVAGTLGQEITEKDGWDDDMSNLAAMFQGGDDLLKAMSDHIGESDFSDGDLDAGLLAPLRGYVADFATTGDPLFQDAHDAVTADPSNPPPPDGTPPPNPCAPTLANPWPCGFGGGPGDINPV